MTTEVEADEELPAEPTSAGRARRLVREVVAGRGQHELLEAAELAISEIVTNALVHAGTAMRLRILAADRRLRFELEDGGSRLPHPRDFGPSASTGRGLRLVDQLVSRWGAHASPIGKVVWFEISEDPEADDLDLADDEPAPYEQERVSVELLRMPLLMHQAWQEHASALLRELMLVRLDAGLDALTEHARASDALGILEDQVPVPHIGMEPAGVMANAIEPDISEPRLVIEVPRTSLPSFEALDVLMNEAVHLADSGRLLAPPSQPEIESLRRWICGQVRSQAAGGDAAPWYTLSTEAPPARTPIPADHWSPDELSRSDRAVVAADDFNAIVAVSRSALDLLGYDDAADLVGRRLLSIIPERFHQAHIAGFTMFLVNGRAPLLGQEITVPVLRADDTEVERRLLITAQSLAGGRHVFVAEFPG
ncbi:ATP-binding protein [Nocardioides coralli]|uniref:ATP-binding protein n=1 Tax=Nocardioides coralli TaxID=2872154 RepID=UPI001CA3A734|nr:ATP-binding protein [Nocardioides coralli]QZY30616.1 ATP-binding protein [Nocardioides coralli]